MQTKPPLEGKIVLITGAARRIGRGLALACACAGADVIVHHGHSRPEAQKVKEEIAALGRRSWVVSADLSRRDRIAELISRINKIGPLYALINSAAIFAPLSFQETKSTDWDRHMAINLSAPFLLSQAFARQAAEGEETRRIVNILDWRALKPGTGHFPYTISKAALAGMTKMLAVALAPDITVNGLALGAILPPSDQPPDSGILENIPVGRWGKTSEVEDALIFLLTGPAYLTGEIIYVDGGRHLT
jgi:NAD(P)-dependent dehydrogenase (short-subunit alcohol dehydrogenase family)